MTEETDKEIRKELPQTPEQLPPQPEAEFSMPEMKELEEIVPPEKTAEGAKEMLKRIFGRKPKSTFKVLAPRDPMTKQVEKIMEEDLAEAYAALDPIKRQEFKLAGERTAYQIRELLKKTHVKIKKIFFLLLQWLMLLPGVNRYFLEQEAKIKVDKILALKRREDE